MVAQQPARHYDSDSDEEEKVYDAEDVILAFCDGPIASTSAVTLDATVSKLGGSPRFWPCVGSPYPSHEELVCTICNRLLPLVAQLYIPLAEAEDRHRALYVFACVTKECQKKEGWCILDSFASHADRSHWHSVRAFTASRWDAALAADYDARQAAEKKKEEEARAAAERAKSPVNPFSANASAFNGHDSSNPFSLSSFDSALPPTGDADDTASETTSEDPLPVAPPAIAEPSWPSSPSLPAFYLDTSYEPAATSAASKPISYTSEATQESGNANETYESVMPDDISPEFLAFTLRVSRPGCSSQVIRTSATPLSFAPGPVEPTKLECDQCGAERRFEAQVMPQAVSVLEKGLREGEELGWSTALIWTCSNSDCIFTNAEKERGLWLEEGVRLQYE